MSPPGRPRVLLVGGGSGFVGRALVLELSNDHEILSVHRSVDRWEQDRGVAWVPTDIAGAVDWDSRLRGVDVVVNLAWYRTGSDARFRTLCEGLERMLAASVRSGLGRIVQVSVPGAPESLETSLPYLVYKRRFDRAVEHCGLSFAILRPSALFGPGDKLLGVMMRSIHRAPFFPMFGDGGYRISPLAVRDFARIVRWAVHDTTRGTFDLGGPAVYRYLDLTRAMFDALGKPPRYWRLSPNGSLRLASFLEGIGSHLLYRYEVEWLMSDRLGLPPARLVDGSLETVEPYLRAVAAELRGTRAAPTLPPEPHR